MIWAHGRKKFEVSLSILRRHVGRSVAYSLNCSCCPLICLLHAACSRPMLIHSVACSLAFFKRLGKRIMSGVSKHLFQKMTRSWVKGHKFGCNKFYRQLCSLTCSLTYLLVHQLGLMIKSLPKCLSTCIPCMPYHEKRGNCDRKGSRWQNNDLHHRSVRAQLAQLLGKLKIWCSFAPLFSFL